MKMENFKLDEQFLLDRQTTSGYMFRALAGVAREMGGEELRQAVMSEAIAENSFWPNPKALQMLEDRQSGSAEAVIERMEAIQTAAHEAEEKALRHHYRLGSSLLGGIKSIFGPVQDKS